MKSNIAGVGESVQSQANTTYFADGFVRFVINTVDVVTVWRALATIAGGETLGSW